MPQTQLKETMKQKNLKIVNYPDYHYIFNKETGFFARWGKTKEEDPSFSPLGPEILDIEISTICHQGCNFCYKSNTSKGTNMSLETFKKILSKIPNNLCQIAFGIGSLDSNLDLWKIMAYTREQGYVPNITINGSRMTPADYQKLAVLCGAVAVSNYNKDQCYNAVEELNRWKQKVSYPTLKQVNIHQLLSVETLDKCWELLHDMQIDPRLKDLNAVVFLLLKPKGKRNKLTQLKNASQYRELVNYALNHNLRIGFDSCSASSFMRAIEGHKRYKELEQCAEPCESTCFSLYINVDGFAVPCSFCEGEPSMKPINMLEVNDFMKGVWFGPELTEFRNKLLKAEKDTGYRQCPVFDLEITE